MTEALKKLFDSYYNVLCKVGYMSQNNTNILLIIAFLRHYLGYKASYITKKELKEITDMFECLLNNSCLTLDIPQKLSALIDMTPSGDTSGAALFIEAPEGKLPTEDISKNSIYLVPREDAVETNIYTEYFYKNNKWENLGESNSITEDTIDTLFE